MVSPRQGKVRSSTSRPPIGQDVHDEIRIVRIVALQVNCVIMLSIQMAYDERQAKEWPIADRCFGNNESMGAAISERPACTE